MTWCGHCFNRHCKPIYNFRAARWKFRAVTQAPSDTGHLLQQDFKVG